MLLQFICNNETLETDLADGTVTVGGDVADGVHISGLPPALLTLTVMGDSLQVTAARALKIGAALFPAHVPRLLLAGESLQLAKEIVLTRPVDAKAKESRKNLGTAFLAKELIGNDFSPIQTRAAGFTCVAGNDVGTHFSVAFVDCTLGRGEDVDIRIRDRAVSRRHARLYREQKKSMLVGLNATNGVFVNGKRIDAAIELKDGDIVELGQTMLRFESGERAPEERTILGAPSDFGVVQPPAESSARSSPAVPEIEVSLTDEGRAELSDEEAFPDPAPTRQSLDLWLMALGAILALAGAAISVCVLR
jgi:Inner membrane component of T3SS, cytoplasmic domain